MRVLLINNTDGIAGHIDVDNDLSVDQFLRRQIRGYKPENYLVRVNRQTAAVDQQLREGDHVSVTPTKIYA